MGLRGAGSDGPPAATINTIDSSQYAVSTAIADALASRWMNKPALAPVCDMSLESDFREGGLDKHGDNINIEVADTFRVSKGLTFDPQPRQTRLVPLVLDESSGIHFKEDFYTRRLYVDPKKAMQNEQRRADRMIDEVEASIGAEWRARYSFGFAPSNQTRNQAGAITSQTLTPGGLRSTTHPGAQFLLDTQAHLEARGITDREYCAIMDPTTNASVAGAMMNAPYSQAPGQQGYASGTVGGMKFGWALKRSVHTGTQQFGKVPTNPQVNAAPANGATTITIKGLANGKQIVAGMRLEFDGVQAVNAAAPDDDDLISEERASWVVAETVDATGATASVTLQEPIRFATAGEAGRRRNCSKQPAANAKVYFYGQDLSVAPVVSSLEDKTARLSWLVARDTCMLVFLEPELPKQGRIQGKIFKSRDYKLSFSILEDTNLQEFGSDWRLDARWGKRVHEPEGGVGATGSTR